MFNLRNKQKLWTLSKQERRWEGDLFETQTFSLRFGKKHKGGSRPQRPLQLEVCVEKVCLEPV